MKNSHEILKIVQFQTSSKPFDTETVTTLGLEFLPSVECQPSTYRQSRMEQVNTRLHQYSGTGSLVSKEDFVEPYADERVATSWARAGRWQRNTMADSLDGALS